MSLLQLKDNINIIGGALQLPEIYRDVLRVISTTISDYERLREIQPKLPEDIRLFRVYSKETSVHATFTPTISGIEAFDDLAESKNFVYMLPYSDGICLSYNRLYESYQLTIVADRGTLEMPEEIYSIFVQYVSDYTESEFQSESPKIGVPIFENSDFQFHCRIREYEKSSRADWIKLGTFEKQAIF